MNNKDIKKEMKASKEIGMLMSILDEIGDCAYNGKCSHIISLVETAKEIDRETWGMVEGEEND